MPRFFSMQEFWVFRVSLRLLLFVKQVLKATVMLFVSNGRE